MNLAGRTNINLKIFGPATTVLYAARQKAPVTFIVTRRCNLDCRPCFSSRGLQDLDFELATETARELQGLGRLYFSGGEPSRYAADEQKFFDLTHAVAERVGQLCIDTNGSFLPADPTAAESYLSQFPRNTVLVLSVDGYHAAALSKQDRSLAEIFRAMKEACGKNALGFEVNLRYSKTKGLSGEIEEMEELLGKAAFYHLKAYKNKLQAQGNASQLPLSEVKPISLADFVEHSHKLMDVGIFITPEGLVVSSDHAAFLPQPPSFAVWGDLRQATLASILWERVLPGVNWKESAFFTYESRRIVPFFNVPFTKADSQTMIAQIKEKRPAIPIEEVGALIHDKSQSVIWEINYEKEALLESFDQREISKALKAAAQDFVAKALKLHPREEHVMHSLFIVKQGQLALDIEFHSEIDDEADLNGFRKFLNFNLRHHLPKGDWIRKFFIGSLYEYAKDLLSESVDLVSFRYLQILFEVIEAINGGEHTEELIAMIKDNSLSFEWEINFSDDSSCRNPLNRKIFEVYQETDMDLTGDVTSLVGNLSNNKYAQLCLKGYFKGENVRFVLDT